MSRGAFENTMGFLARLAGLCIVALGILPGCASHVRVEERFPEVVSSPRDLSGVLVLDQEFRTFVAHPSENTSIQLGEAQVELMSKAFAGLFTRLKVVSSRAEAGPGADLVIVPSVRDVQVSTPSESYLNVYEVWIKYSLDIESNDGVPIDSWFLPAYGKTPYSTLWSRTSAIEEAAVIALRDAGAKLILDFYRIPAVHGYLEQYASTSAEP